MFLNAWLDDRVSVWFCLPSNTGLMMMACSRIWDRSMMISKNYWICPITEQATTTATSGEQPEIKEIPDEVEIEEKPH